MACNDPCVLPDAPSPPSRLARRAEAEADSRRAFLRLMSHELRTPLNTIIGFAEVISHELHGPLREPRYKEHAVLIRDSGLKLLKLLNQVVEMARLESGAAEFDIQPESIEAACAAALRGVEADARAHGVQLRNEASAAVGWVRADLRGLTTALTNLLVNAVAHSPEGGTVTLTARSATNGTVVLGVRDQGPGVPPDQIRRILRPFEQGEDALARSSEGVGLGLPITRLLCKGMGGSLLLSEAPGGGLLAEIHLQAATPHA